MATISLERALALAREHHRTGGFSQAEALLRQIVAVRPQHAGAWNNLGNALGATGRFDEAITAFHHAISLQPANADAHNNLASALRAKGQIDEAIAVYRQAIAIRPQFADAHNNLGVVLTETGHLDEGTAALRRAIAINASLPQVHCNLGNALMEAGDVEGAIAEFRVASAIRLLPTPGSNLLYAIHFHPGYDARTIAAEHQEWNRQHVQPLAQWIGPHLNDRNPDRPLRIGYVSADFRQHPVGRFLLPLLSHHEKKEVEVFAYSQVFVADAMTERLQTCTACWRSIVGLSDAQVADLIRQDQIDILVDLTMHMANNRLLVFARKPAPVQVTYLAYCSTTGLTTMDYRLSDPHLDPPGQNDSIYSERTVRLPETYWCYQPYGELAQEPSSAPPAETRGTITFGSLNSFCKVSQPVLSTWARLLRMIDGSRLVLHAYEGSHRQRVLDQFGQQGIAPDRVVFVPFLPAEQYFALYQQIDIALDTFPYGGGTTTCDALWMGVPVVTLAGKTAVGRGGLSILSNLGLADLVARTEGDYVQIAAGLSRDHDRLNDLRRTLRQRMSASPLMNAAMFATSVEQAYRRMWRAWCERTSAG